MGDKMRILIVDDDESTRRSLTLIFKRKGYQTETAETGQEAIKKAQKKFFNLALLDLKLPDMDGIELLATLKESHPNMDVIIATAFASLESAMRALNKGASAYITKPMNTDELLYKVREIVEKQHLVMDKRRAEEELAAERSKLKEYFEHLPLSAYNIGLDNKIIDCNNLAVKTLGYKNKEELIGKPLLTSICAPSSREKAKRISLEWKKTGRMKNEELQIITKRGKTLDVLLNADTIYDKDGKPIFSISTQLEITERKRALEALKASLQEKEVLLKEIHHRVKNNMQIIYSLLNLQSRHIKNKKVLNMLQESQNRIRSMALLHEKLYQSKDLARIDFGDYIRKLTSGLFHTYGINPDFIMLKINVENVFLNINTAIPCGLIINELVSNSLNHAFPEGGAWSEKGHAKGKISISLSSDNNKFTLIVGDNGIGLPKDLDFQKTESLGLQLVNTLVEQLEASIKHYRKYGTSFRIEFTPKKRKNSLP